ncbi:unnamed protein product [Camellia sinensis]
MSGSHDASVRDDGTGGSSSEKAVVPSSDVTSENPNLDTIALEDAGDADIGKIPGETHELRPLLQMLAGSPPMLASMMRQAFKGG